MVEIIGEEIVVVAGVGDEGLGVKCEKLGGDNIETDEQGGDVIVGCVRGGSLWAGQDGEIGTSIPCWR